MADEERTISGWIDRITLSLQLGGWARHAGEPRHEMVITARHGTIVLGRSSLRPAHETGSSAFEIQLQGPMAVAASRALMTGELELLADEVPLALFSGARHAFRNLDLFQKNEPSGHLDSFPKCPDMPETSGIAVPLGFQSANKTTIVGRHGYLFLYSGNNDLLAQYLAVPGSSAVVGLASAWAGLIRARAARLGGKCRFIQVVIPEKTSALSTLFPRPLQTPTPVYKALVNQMAHEPDVVLIDCLPFLNGKAGCFTKLDSHLSARGCYEIFCHLLSALSLPRAADLAFGAADTATGDLGTHLFGNPVTELLDDELALVQDGIHDSDLVLTENVHAQGHVGTRCVWHNPSAPNDVRVVAFANSFFDTGETPRRLSWWCARWFKEFHFVWNASVDDDYINAVKPDIVIAQTIERFLARLPAT